MTINFVAFYLFDNEMYYEVWTKMVLSRHVWYGDITSIGILGLNRCQKEDTVVNHSP